MSLNAHLSLVLTVACLFVGRLAAQPCGDRSVGGGTVSDVDGNVYPTVVIGEQCWMARNLSTERFRDGSLIPGGLKDKRWRQTTQGAASTISGERESQTHEGMLYNGYAVLDARGLCPSGWRVPTEEDWMCLTEVLGGNGHAGGRLKASPSDEQPWNGNNRSGFMGLPVGRRDAYGEFVEQGSFGHWWSSTRDGEGYLWSRHVSDYQD